MNAIEKHMAQVEEGMTLLDVDEVKRVVEGIRITKRMNLTVYLFGNGGSHATASHFANDLAKMVKVRAVCVGDMTPITSAYGNDNGWENMFRGYLDNALVQGDCLIGISCGGRSENVLRGLRSGLALNCLAFGMTGMGKDTPINKLGLDGLVHASVSDIRVQEDLHLMVCHAVVRSLQEAEHVA